MYCTNDLCSNLLPYKEHFQYDYGVESIDTIWSGFTSIGFECNQSKHKDEFFGCCAHFREYKPDQEKFTFFSNNIEFDKQPELWYEGMNCNLYNKEIEDSYELVLNLRDMCQFHEHCLKRLLHSNDIDLCPGCDVTRCKACWKCSY